MVTVAYLLTIVSFPIRAIGWLLGEFPRSVVGYRRAKAVLAATGNMEYGDDELPRADDAAPCSRSRTSTTPTTPTRRCCAASTSTYARAAPSRWSARRPPARAP